MKNNICKVLLIIFTLCFLYGCDERIPSDVAEVSETQNSETQSGITKSIISKADLTQREIFLFDALSMYEQPVAFDAMWHEDFHNLNYKLYSFENNDWNQIREDDFGLENNMVLIAVGFDLSSFNISIYSRDKEEGRGTRRENQSENDYSNVDDIEILNKQEIEKGKEIPVIAYRQYGSDEMKNARLSDFTRFDKVKMDEDEKYLILTFTFE